MATAATGNGQAGRSARERAAFDVAGRTWRWGDVVSWAQERGDWAVLADRTRHAAACLAAARRDGVRLEPQARAAGDAQRRARRLLSAEDAEAWLTGWGIGVGEWGEHLRRSVAVALPPASATPPADAPVDLERQTEVDAICSGALEQLGDELAARLAVAGPDTPPGAEGLERAYAAFCADAASPAVLQRLLEVRALDWARADVEVLLLASEPAAREAVLCLREDGMAPAEVAGQAGARHDRHVLLLEDALPAERPLVLGAAPGAVLGPVPRDGGWAVLVVHSRAVATLEDAEVRTRAERDAVAGAVARVVGERVRWHDPR